VNRIAMSPAASGLLRCIIARASVSRDRILLTEVLSTDWQSLVFLGERHQYHLPIPGPDPSSMSTGSAMDWKMRSSVSGGQIVADIAVVGRPAHGCDGSTSIMIEAA
jgi:hypothetical protein